MDPDTASYHYETALCFIELMINQGEGNDRRLAKETLLKMGLDEQQFRAGRLVDKSQARGDLRSYLEGTAKEHDTSC